MKNNNLSLTIILPTLNEGKNLEILIPEVSQKLDNISYLDYEIKIIDDNSDDDTDQIVSQLRDQGYNATLFKRKDPPSLPMSIYDGINLAENDYVMWLDADGSMTPKAIKKLVLELNEDREKVIVGSRFTKDGGYKGVKDIGTKSLFTAMKNVKNSNDSVFGMIFSIMFNKFLIFIFPYGVKDLTSGFVIGKREYFKESPFSKSEYGEYFIYMIKEIYSKGITISEIGYICETRIAGESKTANSLLQLFKRGIPYIKAAFICRFTKYGN